MKNTLRLAMLGMIPGNAHPYSWSSIINGFDPSAMAACPNPVIPRYMLPHGSKPLEGARVTHIWTDDPDEAPRVARTAFIDRVVDRPEDVIGAVDGVIIATDDGNDHVRRARPFVEAGLPVFVDKPLATNAEDLRQFAAWTADGARIMSSSGLRYAPELDGLGADWRWISAATPKSWERYGIHLLEPVARLLGPGFESVRLVGGRGSSVAHLAHRSGTAVTLAALEDATGGAFRFHFHGTSQFTALALTDTYTAFRRQLEAVIKWLQGAPPPVPFGETQELMRVLIAGRESRERNGAEVRLAANC
jgi:predicted dehydrogenase